MQKIVLSKEVYTEFLTMGADYINMGGGGVG